MAEFQQNVTVECIVINETEKAVKITFGDGREQWIPKSQVDDRSEVFKRGDAGKIIINEWFALKEKIG